LRQSPILKIARLVS